MYPQPGLAYNYVSAQPSPHIMRRDSNTSSLPGSPSRQTESIPTDVASAYKRDKDGQLLWFAAPPVHVTPLPQPVHSVEYLEWKKRQKEKEHQHQQQQKQQQQKPDQQ